MAMLFIDAFIDSTTVYNLAYGVRKHRIIM